jgi:hypothetical protein
MATRWPVHVVDPDGLRAWRDRAEVPAGELMATHSLRKVEQSGETALCWLPDGRFSWICPGCGCLSGGQLGDEPVSGWDAPRWVNSGSHDRPTLTPSLGCPGWRHGRCTGHWWLRDGVLEAA